MAKRQPRKQPVIRRRSRRRRKHSINYGRLIITTLLVLLAGELCWAAMTSPWFSIHRVKARGLETISEKDVLHRLCLPKDANIFRIDKKELSGRIMKNPVIEEVRIYRHLPDTLLLRIVERKPALVLRSGEKMYDVDDTGIPFRVIKQPRKNLPIISCKVRNRIVLGKPIRSANFNKARECLLLTQEKKIFRVGEITVDQSNDLCLNDRDGFQVKLGRPEQLGTKLNEAARVVKEIPEFRQRGEYIDVTCPGYAAMKLKE